MLGDWGETSSLLEVTPHSIKFVNDTLRRKMADPHIKSPMDRWDYTTVIIYRLGFVFAVPMLFILPWYPTTAHFGLLIRSDLMCRLRPFYI